MTKTLRAHFDGKVFVPDEPVDVPVGEPLEIAVRVAPAEPNFTANGDGTLADLVAWIASRPPVDRGDMPTDGSINYKHYLYGHPKQP